MAAYDFPDTAGKPTDGSFEYTAPDGTLYEWNGYAWVVPTDESGGGSGGAARVLTQVLPPSPAEDGDMYWCTDDGRLYLYYDDADTKQWVDASPDGGGNNVEKLIAGDNITLSPADGKGVVTINSTGGGGGTSTPQKVAILAETKPNNTNAGQNNTGWNLRGLSTITSDEHNLVTLSANVFTLKAGTYLIQWSVPGYKVDRMNSRLKSGSTVVAEGSAIYAGAAESSQIISTGSAYVNITADTQYQIEHYCQTGNAQGLGIASNSGQDEVYTQVTITDLSSGGGGGGGGGPTTPGVRYQQGTINPSVDGGVTLSSNAGFWSRVGNSVSIQYYVSSGGAGGAEAFALTLPYITTDNYSQNGSSIGSVMFKSINIGDDKVLSPYVAGDSAIVLLYTQSQLGGDWEALIGSQINANASFFIQVTYLTDDTTYVPAVEAVVTEDIQGTGGSGGGDATGVGADAWGSFDGAGASAIINSSMNIESITKNGAGNYSIVFITPMPASDYAVTTGHLARGVSKTTTGFDLQTFNFDGGAASFSDIQFAVHASSTVTPTYTWTRDGTTLKPANDGDGVQVGASYDNVFLTSGKGDGTSPSQLVINGRPASGSNNALRIDSFPSNGTTQATGAVINYDGSAVLGKGSSDSNGTRGIRIVQGTFSPLLSIDSASGGGANVVFQTNLDGAPTYRLNGNGTIVTRGIQIETDTDNPANFSAEGEYNGATLDVKALLLTLQTAAARIATLEAKVATLESDHTTLMNNNNNNNGGGY